MILLQLEHRANLWYYWAQITLWKSHQWLSHERCLNLCEPPKPLNFFLWKTKDLAVSLKNPNRLALVHWDYYCLNYGFNWIGDCHLIKLHFSLEPANQYCSQELLLHYPLLRFLPQVALSDLKWHLLIVLSFIELVHVVQLLLHLHFPLPELIDWPKAKLIIHFLPYYFEYAIIPVSHWLPLLEGFDWRACFSEDTFNTLECHFCLCKSPEVLPF